MLDQLPGILTDPLVLICLVLWSLIWKGWALWRAARLKQLGWYLALLVINTLGIFEMLYLLVTNKYNTECNGCRF